MARFLEGLAAFSRLIVFDKRGTGLSDRFSPQALPTLEERMSDLRAVMDAAGSERAVLFGTLGGAAMAGLFAASHPERTRALIVYGSFAKLSPTTGVLTRLSDSREVALDRVEHEWGNASVGITSWAPNLIEDEPQAEAYLRLLRSSMSPSAARASMELGFQVDWEASMPAIRVPTLVLHRAGDVAVRPLRDVRWPHRSREPGTSSSPGSTTSLGSAIRRRSCGRCAGSWRDSRRPPAAIGS